ncbi:hypothetical protein NHH03_24995 [Stieleria sp. TO1_6]|uniref:hypothetical protein n=1 Tax=Stieleria tagensis TaxID=2956795 RepID=UPI00209B904A|nr:hypothetical protein [Stieleria tagensis]MCO8125018.1 hypothetical protein [Stieleria tagensis]
MEILAAHQSFLLVLIEHVFMQKPWIGFFCVVALVVAAGCAPSGPPQPVTADEDEIAAYERMLAGEGEESGDER